MLVKADEFIAFLKRVDREKIDGFNEVITPAKPKFSNQNHTYFSKITSDSEIILDSYRSVDPVKILYYLVRESLNNETKNSAKRIIAGVKQCDLKALQLLDIALINNNFIDPDYRYWRSGTLLIASDCGEIGANCYCNLVDGKPYAQTGFDINISRVNDNYFIEAGTSEGEKFLRLIKEYVHFNPADDKYKEIIRTNRESLFSELVKKNSHLEIEKNFKNMRHIGMTDWKDESLHCVGCGACTNICPTCYCLILNDESEAHKFVKVRSYDSCQYNGYARVAGGGTPRPKMFERFRNRYLCKFLYMKDNFDLYGCTGCGRCTEACPGEINFMKVIKTAVEKFQSAEK